MEPSYEVVWPKSPRSVEPGRLANRLDELDGKTIGFLWDYVFRGDELFPTLERELRGRFPAITIVNYDVFGNSHDGDEAKWIAGLPDALADQRVDAVVSAVGC